MEVIRLEAAQSSIHYQDTQKLTYRSDYDGWQDWALLERTAGRAGRVWVIVLHGHGSEGDQLYTRNDVATTWLPAIRKRGLSILAPNLRGNAWMCKAAVEDLHALIGYARWNLDAEKFVLLSGSMGGTGALIYGTQYPWDIAGICALCPATDIGRYWQYCLANGLRKPILAEIGAAIETSYGGTPLAAPAAYEEHSALARAGRFIMPVFLVHGDKDDIIPVEESRRLAAALQNGNPKSSYVELKGGHHDSPLAEAVRGLDWILAENPALAVPTAPVVEASMDRGSALYRCGERATATFTIPIADAIPGSGTGSAVVAMANRTAIHSTRINWTAGVPATLSGTLKEPGFLRFEIKLDLPDKPPASAFCVAGFEPEGIKPAPECPTDFRSFWEEGRKQLGQPAVTLEKIDKFSSPLVTTYLLSFPNLDGWTTHGFLVIPNGSGKYPALVRVCDGGAGAASPWVSRPDAIGLTLVVHNIRPAFDHLEMLARFDVYNRPHGGAGWHITHGMPDREKYYYRYPILGADYAIDYLATRPEWDGKHLVINGSSQGGMFSLFMAGLNAHLTAAVATVPSFCDLAGGPYAGRLLQGPRSAAARSMLPYYDAVNFARFIRCPIVFGVGFLDGSCPPGGVYAAYNAVASRKEIISCPQMGHGQLTLEYRDTLECWINRQLGIVGISGRA